ncbi:MAG: polyketide synthase dehydratase domain-containing protein [Polyangiaceae bacterium]|nr:polyketide synthase dehydratase domain-containing protein [Polyangiaceae bacterium]
MTFAPIAIVGQSCLLPGAASSADLSRAVLESRDLLSSAPPGRWRVSHERVKCDPATPRRDAAWSDRGGYVHGFEQLFDPHGFLLPADELAGLDPLFLWVLHTARGALQDAGLGATLPAALRGALVMGNLSFPTDGLSRLAEATWLRRLGLPAGEVDPRNRFSSGLPAHLASVALGLRGRAFALDAACASSLYAIKLACDLLHDGAVDVAVAGAVNKTDDLFIHVGFCALQAMSRTGRSRPFHREADGLVPAEGAGFVVLRRLGDALAEGQRILGVIRGVGLSNDGRGAGGMLAPSSDGQLRAIELAYREAGLGPSEIGLLECHATGTPVGDATELRSMGRMFAGLRGVPIGSLKSNLGHLITVAGVAGLQKVLGAMAAGTLPPTLHADQPLDELASSPFRLITRPEPWNGPLRASVSAFGFGGNNAHLIVEAPPPPTTSIPRPPPAAAPADLAVVACALTLSGAPTIHDFRRELLDSPSGRPLAPLDAITLPISGLRFPPRDLERALPQQLAMLQTAREVLEAAGPLPLGRTSVLVGMGCDAEIARYGGRWRVAEWAGQWGADEAWIRASQDAFAPPLEAAGVLGTMPNIPANRLNSQFDCGGPSFTISSEELSGLEALRIAARALRHGEIDAALVGAADFSIELVHEQALARIAPRTPPAGDAAVALVLRRLDDARRDGNPILAIVPGEAPDQAQEQPSLQHRFGKAHAASALVDVVAAVTTLSHGSKPSTPARPWLPSSAPHALQVSATALLGHRDQLTLTAPEQPQPVAFRPPPRVLVFRGADRSSLLRQLDQGAGGQGPAALALVASSGDELTALLDTSRQLLASGQPLPLSPVPGVFFREQPLDGKLGFVFGGPASIYPGMGRELVLAIPELTRRLSRRFRRIEEVAGWVYEGADFTGRKPVEKLWAASFLMQLHAELTRGVLGLKPAAYLGISSGETNALFASGAWTDLDAMFEDIEACGLYSRELAGDFEAARVSWGLPERTPIRWVNHRVLAPIEQVRQALRGELRAHLTLIHSAHDVVIGGDADACARVLERVGKGRGRALGYDLVVHCGELEPFREAWWKLHHRPTSPIHGARMYSHAHGGSYELSAEAAADALLGQALRTVDFPALVRQAHDDGVRIFLEHGPHDACSRWIETALGERDDYATIALDRHGEDPILQAVQAAASLLVLGVEVDLAALLTPLERAWSSCQRAPIQGPTLSFPAHRPPPALPPLPAAMTTPSSPSLQIMAPAPSLPSALAMDGAPAVPAVRSGPPEGPRPAPAPPVAAVPQPPRISPAVQAPPVVAAPPAPLAAPAAPFVAPAALAPAYRSVSATGAAGAILALQQSVAGVHRAFLDQQTSLHRRFLALQGAFPLGADVAETPAPAWAPPVPSAPAVSPAVVTSVAATTPVLPAAPPATVTRAPAAIAPQPPTASALPVVLAKPSPAVRQEQPEATGPLPGPKFSRQDLEELASGKISKHFGPLFEQQDGFERQVRMPMPPLLLADRVTGLKAEPGLLKTGTIWTETDVRWDDWYLHEGHIPGGIMIEAGQADLLLISWMGIDFLNRGERIYRLLGCDLRYHGPLPKPGDTLRYDIHVDGHAKHEDVRLFFFHYDCKVDGQVRLSVRHGQAGFFTEQELANSGGILWEVESGERTENPRLAAPRTPGMPGSYARAAIDAVADGRPWECFGPSHNRARTHTRTPRVGGGRLQLFDEITHLDPKGGPWGRGYFRAVQKISPEDWFFTGHFKGDPCMPGTLMFEGCQQAMAFYLLAMGFALDADGWTFEPVPDETYKLRCRGQVIPSSKELIYELFVDEIIDGPVPTLYADLLCTVDGLKAFHCRRMGMRLAPDWPMNRRQDLLELEQGGEPVASHEGFPFDFRSLTACAWGRPSEAFGPMYRPFDGHRRTPRLPGAPYHFVSRIERIDGPINVVQSGTSIVAAYDVPPDAWYFDENGAATMPYCVLLEAALQPCGWLASATGITLTTQQDLCFRNLDGTATWHREVRRDAGTIRTQTKLIALSRSAGMVIVGFDVRCLQGDALVYEMKTVFGFFPPEALANQVGLSVGEEEQRWLAAPSDYLVDLAAHPARFFGGSARLASDKIRMIDRLTGYWPEGGKAGLGRMRAVKDIDPGEWFFKAHFFQDPVQPGSLGIEAMIQVLQAFMLQHGMDRGMRRPRFEPLAMGEALTWKYRGQVVPENKLVTTEIEITRLHRDERGVLAVADAWLWVDGMCIYQGQNLAMRIVDEGDGPGPRAEGAGSEELTLSHEGDPWIADHRPTYTVPALPAMYMVDRLAAAAQRRSGLPVRALEKVSIRRWAPAPGPLRTRDTAEPLGDGRYRVRFEIFREASNPALSRFEIAAEGEAEVGPHDPAPTPWTALADLRHQEDPYTSATLFHGPSFQLLRSWSLGAEGASAVLDLGASKAPLGALNVGLLDGATHAIPHDALGCWFQGVSADQVAYPARVESLRIHGPTPTQGELRVEVRPDGFDGEPRFPRFRLQLLHGGAVWAELTLVEALFPKGPLGLARPADRRAFLQHRRLVPGLALSRTHGEETHLDPAAVAASNWLPGTIEAAYRAAPGEDLVTQVAVKEHLGRQLGVHPSAIEVRDGKAWCPARPLEALSFETSLHGTTLQVRSPRPARLSTVGVRAFWRERLASPTPPVADLYFSLAERFVGRIELEDPDDFARLRGRSVVFLANHQVAIESPLFSMLVSSLIDGVVVTIAKMEHKTGWLGRLIAHSFSYPGAVDPQNIVYFDRADKSSLLGLATEMATAMMEHRKSILVHVEGTRALSCEARVEKISSIWSDVSTNTDSPIVPVRFAHALPLATPERLEFPVGYGKQGVYLGKALWPDELRALPLPDRKRRVLDAINAAGPAVDTPCEPDPTFVQIVEDWRRRTGATEPQAVLLLALERYQDACLETRELIRAIHAGRLDLPDSPEGAWLRSLARHLA